MHPDRKIGFAMGILLIGIVSALFFRNEPMAVDAVPTVRREKELNEQLRARDVAVYLDEEPAANETADPSRPAPPNWTLRNLLDELHDRNDGVPLPVGANARGTQISPDPIDDFDSPATQDLHGDILTDKRSGILPATPNTSSKLPPLIAPLGPALPAEEPTTLEVTADEPGQPGEFDEYVVQYGDTLSGIAERFLGSQAKFQEVFEANRDRLSAPDRLQVGKAIRIPRYQ